MNPIRAWNTFWFKRISAKPLGVFRIAFGLIGLANLALLVVDHVLWLSGEGLLRGTEAQEYAGPLRFSILNYYQSPLAVRLVLGSTALAFVGLTIGLHTRVMSVLCYLGMLMIHHRNVATTSGADVLLMCTCFNMTFCPSGAAYSIDARRATRKRGTYADALIEPWGMRLIQVQVSLIYFVTAILKCNGATWLNGTALHYVLNNPEVGRFNLYPLQEYPLAINLLTLSGLVAEFVLACGLWFRPTRRWTAIIGVLLHFGVLFIVNIPIFGELMTACYLLFLDPDELASLLAFFNPKTWMKQKERAVFKGRIDAGSPLHRPHVRVRTGEPVESEQVAHAEQF